MQSDIKRPDGIGIRAKNKTNKQTKKGMKIVWLPSSEISEMLDRLTRFSYIIVSLKSTQSTNFVYIFHQFSQKHLILQNWVLS